MCFASVIEHQPPASRTSSTPALTSQGRFDKATVPDMRPAASQARSRATDPWIRRRIERRTSSSITANLSSFVSRCLRPKAKSDRAINVSPTSFSATCILAPLRKPPHPPLP